MRIARPPTRRRTDRLALLIGTTLSLVAGGCRTATGSAEWPYRLSQSAQSRLEAWLFCDECDRGERVAAAGVGNDAVHPLAQVLAEVPDPWLDNLRARYGTAAARAMPVATRDDSAAYVTRHLANFVATLQSRSAFALGDISTSEAIGALQAALDSAVTRAYRADVVRAVEQALRSATTPGFTGTIRDTVADFLDTVWVLPGGQAWDGDESAVLHSAPFPSDVTVFQSPDSLGLVAVGKAGQYALSILNIGPTQDSGLALLRITSYPGLLSNVVPELTAGPFPRTILGSVSRATSPTDLVHYFRFQPSADLAVSPTVDWDGPGQIDLLWDECPRRVGSARSPGAVAGTVLNPAGNEMGGVQVLLPGAAVAGVTGADGRFSLAVPPGWSGSLRASRSGFAPIVLPVWEGLADIVVVLGAASPFVATAHQAASPNSAPLTIPAGACRLLGVVKRDTLEPSTIIRLRITSP